MINNMKVLHLTKQSHVSDMYDVFVKKYDPKAFGSFSDKVSDYVKDLEDGKIKIYVSALEVFLNRVGMTDYADMELPPISRSEIKEVEKSERISTAEKFIEKVDGLSISSDAHGKIDGTVFFVHEVKGIFFEWQGSKAVQKATYVYFDPKKQGIV